MAKITDQYLLYINNMHVLNFDLAAEYLLMAAMLIAIKSRMLLPKPEVITGDEEAVDPRQELINKLLEYEKIKQGANLIDSMPMVDRDFLWLNVKIDECNNVLPDLVMDDLLKAWRNLLLKARPEEQHHIKRAELSIREHMTNILRILNNVKQTAFENLFPFDCGVPVIVVNFIAILELTKEGMIGIASENNAIIVRIV